MTSRTLSGLIQLTACCLFWPNVDVVSIGPLRARFSVISNKQTKIQYLKKMPCEECRQWSVSTFRWISAQETQLHCWRTGVTSFLHWPMDLCTPLCTGAEVDVLHLSWDAVGTGLVLHVEVFGRCWTTRATFGITAAPDVIHHYKDMETYYSDVIMSAMASQITGVSIVYLTYCSGADQRKHQSSPSLAFVRGIHRWPVNSTHKGPVTRKLYPFDAGVMTIEFALPAKWP